MGKRARSGVRQAQATILNNRTVVPTAHSKLQHVTQVWEQEGREGRGREREDLGATFQLKIAYGFLKYKNNMY